MLPLYPKYVSTMVERVMDTLKVFWNEECPLNKFFMYSSPQFLSFSFCNLLYASSKYDFKIHPLFEMSYAYEIIDCCFRSSRETFTQFKLPLRVDVVHDAYIPPAQNLHRKSWFSITNYDIFKVILENSLTILCVLST